MLLDPCPARQGMRGLYANDHNKPSEPTSKLPQPSRSRSLSLNAKMAAEPPRSRSLSCGEGNKRKTPPQRPVSEKAKSRLPVRVQNRKCPKCLCISCMCPPCPENESKPDLTNKNVPRKPARCTNNCRTCMCHFCLKDKKKKLEEKVNENQSSCQKNLIRSRWEQEVPKSLGVMSTSHPATCQCEKCSGKTTSVVQLKNASAKRVHPSNCLCQICIDAQNYFDTFDNLDDILYDASEFEASLESCLVDKIGRAHV